jgi:hypothetical protein
VSLEDGFYDRNGQPITQPRWETLFADTDYRLIDELSLDDRQVQLQWRGEKNGVGQKYPFAVVTHYATPSQGGEAGFDTLAEATAYWRERITAEGNDYDLQRGVTPGGNRKAPRRS